MKIVYSVLATLVVSAVLGLFTLNSRVTTLEAKVPAIEHSHEMAQVIIFEELGYIKRKVDTVVLLLTTRKQGE